MAQLPAPGSAPAATAEGEGLPAPAAAPFASTQHRWYPKVYGDSVRGHRLLREKESIPGAAFVPPYEPGVEPGTAELPLPEKLPSKAKRLSLDEAIALALRLNPNVRTSELQRILDKFSLELVLQNSKVNWSPLTLSSTVQNGAVPVWAAGTGIAVNAISGTTFGLTQTNNLLGGMGTTALTATQHLLKGFGFAVNRVQYQNAFDSEKVNRLTFKNNVITTVNTVIVNYRALVQAYNSLDTTKQNLASQIEMVNQSKLQVKSGTMAPSDLLQQQTNVASARLSVVQQQDALRDALLTFLSSLGVRPTAKITIDRKISIDDAQVPPLQKCIEIAMKHNIAYQQALLNLGITKRGLITANDARKWTLDVTGAVSEGSQRSGDGQPITNISTNPSMEFSLSVPIDNISLKQGVVNAKIQIDDAKMNLVQQKNNLVSSVMDQWDAIRNQKQQILISELGVHLQKKTLDNAKLKYQYGKSTVFEINTLTNDLLAQQIALISTDIGYLNDVTTLYATLGTTLDQYKIKLIY